jgi:alkylation response protein AidB-like acyl-CoA dehydrogenase
MALVLNEEQVMLRDAARGFLQERAPVSHLREIRDSGNSDGFSLQLWEEMADMGWTAILVPQEHGGLGYGYTGMGIILEESGRTLTPSPLLSTALTGVSALTMAGSPAQCNAILPDVASGKTLLALACDERSNHQPERVETVAEGVDAGYRLSGRKVSVLDGHAADYFIVSAQTSEGVSLFLVPASADGVQSERYAVLDTHVAADVTFDQVMLPAESLLGELHGGPEVLDQVLDTARIGVSAELLGLAQEVLERTVEYLKERKQFGVPIGSFQALQHRAAHLFGEIELCKSLVLKALQSLDEEERLDPQLASMTKAKLSETAHKAATEAIQMHGGIGMTDDFDIGFFLKRCRMLESLYGDQYFHLDRFARQRNY